VKKLYECEINDFFVRMFVHISFPRLHSWVTTSIYEKIFLTAVY